MYNFNYFSYCNKLWVFWTDFDENLETRWYMRTDRQTDRQTDGQTWWRHWTLFASMQRLLTSGQLMLSRKVVT